MLNLGHIFVFWLRFIDYIAISALKMLKACLSIFFLANFNLLVDMANRLLVNASTSIAAAPADLALQISDTSDAYSSLKSSYPEVFRPVLHLTPQTSAEHGIFQHIKTSSPPVFSKFPRLAPDKLQAAKKIFDDMETMGICQKALKPLGLSSPHRHKKGWFVMPLRRLSTPPQHDNGTRSLPSSQHRRRHHLPPRGEDILQIGPPKGLLPGPHASR